MIGNSYFLFACVWDGNVFTFPPSYLPPTSDTKGVHWIKSSNGIFFTFFSRKMETVVYMSKEKKSFIYNLVKELDQFSLESEENEK